MFYSNKPELKTKCFYGRLDPFLEKEKHKQEQEKTCRRRIKETMSRLKNRSICRKTGNFIATYVLVLENKLLCFMLPETKIANMKFIINAQKTYPSTMTVTVRDIMPMGECTEMGSCVFSGTYGFITVKVILSSDFNNHDSIFMEDARKLLINCQDCLTKNIIDSYILNNPLSKVEFEMNLADVARLNPGLSQLTIPVLSLSSWLKHVKKYLKTQNQEDDTQTFESEDKVNKK